MVRPLYITLLTHTHASDNYLVVCYNMMITLGSKEWLLHTLVCVLIFLTEVTSQVVPITIIEGAVAKGAGIYMYITIL